MNLIPWRNKQNSESSEERELAPMLRHFRTEMDRVFSRFFSEPFGALAEVWPDLRGWGPSLDVSETDTHVVVKAELPGVDPKEVDVRIAGNVLTISGEKSESSERKGESFYHTERRFGSFRRTVPLPAYVDAEKVSAEHANGVLSIQLPKSASATPKRVPVKAT